MLSLFSTIEPAYIQVVNICQRDYLNLKHLQKSDVRNGHLKCVRNGQKHTKNTEDKQVFWINAYFSIEKQSNKNRNTFIQAENRGPSIKFLLIPWFLILNFNFDYIYITDCALRALSQMLSLFSTIEPAYIQVVNICQRDYLNLKHLQKSDVRNGHLKCVRNGQKHTKNTEDKQVFWINAYFSIEKQSNKNRNTFIQAENRGPSIKFLLIPWFLILNFNFDYICITGCALRACVYIMKIVLVII